MEKLGQCRNCGRNWPQLPKPEKHDAPSNDWNLAAEKPTRRRRQGLNVEGAAHKALLTVWDKLSPEVKSELTAAGVKPSPPPGLQYAKGAKSGGDEQAEAAKSLWDSASDAQKQLLRQAGIPEPVVAEPTDLAALCKKHQESLPPSIQQALAQLDPPAPTQTQQIESATRRFKQSTTELRQLIQQTAALQIRIDRAKSSYQELLEKMKGCQSDLQTKQSEVSAMQAELEATIRADSLGAEFAPQKQEPFEGLLETLAKVGISLSPEQMSVYEQAKREQAEKSQPQAMSVDGKDSESASQKQPKEPLGGDPEGQRGGKGRSRSRGRGSQPTGPVPPQG